MSKIEDVLTLIDDMSVLELSELVHAFEQKYGVSAAAVAAAPAAASSAGAAEAEQPEEQTEFDVVLTSAGDKRVQAIKVVREITGLSLTQAKDLVDGAPTAVKEKVSQQEAQDLKAKLEEAGASVEIR